MSLTSELPQDDVLTGDSLESHAEAHPTRPASPHSLQPGVKLGTYCSHLLFCPLAAKDDLATVPKAFSGPREAPLPLPRGISEEEK